jgi:hypothetical protein
MSIHSSMPSDKLVVSHWAAAEGAFTISRHGVAIVGIAHVRTLIHHRLVCLRGGRLAGPDPRSSFQRSCISWS